MAFVLGFLRRVLGLRRQSDFCGMQEREGVVNHYPSLLLHAFFLKGGCWVMRSGLLWRCKMFDRKEREGG